MPKWFKKLVKSFFGIKEGCWRFGTMITLMFPDLGVKHSNNPNNYR